MPDTEVDAPDCPECGEPMTPIGDVGHWCAAPHHDPYDPAPDERPRRRRTGMDDLMTRVIPPEVGRP